MKGASRASENSKSIKIGCIKNNKCELDERAAEWRTAPMLSNSPPHVCTTITKHGRPCLVIVLHMCA